MYFLLAKFPSDFLSKAISRHSIMCVYVLTKNLSASASMMTIIFQLFDEWETLNGDTLVIDKRRMSYHVKKSHIMELISRYERRMSASALLSFNKKRKIILRSIQKFKWWKRRFFFVWILKFIFPFEWISLLSLHFLTFFLLSYEHKAIYNFFSFSSIFLNFYKFFLPYNIQFRICTLPDFFSLFFFYFSLFFHLMRLCVYIWCDVVPIISF